MSLDTIIQDLASLSKDPPRWVLYAFPWGEAGTELEKEDGPEKWQWEILCAIRDGLLTFQEAIRLAVASGHGVGKSALVSWIILWAMSTFEDTRGVVTANTETQLKTKTWAELGKWYRLFIGRDMFHLTATALYSKDPDHERTWRIDMVPWSERSTEAFAGLHNLGKRVLLVFDEASAIPNVIWETSEGALTDKGTQIIWAVFGNPTRNLGRFKDCFERLRHRWQTFQVDSREVRFTDKEQIAEWIADYGEDSDFVRVRVRGVFPRVGDLQFIPTDLAIAASKREVSIHLHDPLILGVDVARFGDDASIIFPRKGRDARSIPYIALYGVDTMTLAGRIAEEHERLRPDAIFIDEGGVGGGVVDRCRQLRVPVVGIMFGSSSDRPLVEENWDKWANKRAEMYGSLRAWLKGGAIPEEQQLLDELAATQYGFNNQDAILLEAKRDIKKRVGFSPDRADALAITFAYPVIPNAMAGREGPKENLVKSEYDPLALARVA